jgi:hypothetical protein
VFLGPARDMDDLASAVRKVERHYVSRSSQAHKLTYT